MSNYRSNSKLADGYCDEKLPPLDPDEVVLTEGTYTLKIDYPLSNPYTEQFTTIPFGLTRRGLVNIIVRAYKAVYNAKDDPYGIWGHGLSDLMLHTASVSPKGTVTVDCDS